MSSVERIKYQHWGDFFDVVFLSEFFFEKRMQNNINADRQKEEREEANDKEKRRMFYQVDKVSSPNCVCYFESILIVVIPPHYAAETHQWTKNIFYLFSSSSLVHRSYRFYSSVFFSCKKLLLETLIFY